MLVVLAITAILMVIMFVPLSRSIDLVKRAETKAKGQDAVRTAAGRIAREMALAMEVYEPRDLQVWGWNAWQVQRGGFGIPVTGATPEPYIVRHGMLVLRLPKVRYYDTVFNHYVTQDDIDTALGGPTPYDYVALGTCPRHGGGTLEVRPLQPLEPDNRLTAYFVGLKDPGYQVGGRPVYDNIALYGRNIATRSNSMNTYVLYRVEFDPADPRYANWQTPGFFYDTAVAANGAPYWQNWAAITVSMMDAETSDAVRWIENNGKFLPQPLCTWVPGAGEEETAQPNREQGQYQLGSGVVPAELPPLEYVTQAGNWTGVPMDGSLAIPPGVLLSPSPTGGAQVGPRIRILDGSAGQAPVFDTTLPLRDRLVSYDNVKGRIVTAFRRWDYTGAAQGTPFSEHFSADILPDATVDLNADVQTDPNGMPSSFGACKAVGTVPTTTPVIAVNTRIVPGSDVVMLYDDSAGAGNPTLGEPLRRAGWTGLGVRLDQNYVSQGELDLDEYKIDYYTGEITLSSKDLSYWSNVGSTQPRKLLIRYRFQANAPTDVVHVSQVTRELLSLNVGLVEYTRRNREFLPFDVSQRVVVRNLRR